MALTAALRLLALSATFSTTGGLKGPAQLQRPFPSLVQTDASAHKLRVCNAFPDKDALEVYLNKDKLSTKPLSYKTCEEFKPSLNVNDKVNFKVEGLNVGTFSIADLPKSSAVLLVVIHRQGVASSAVAFESHVFANLDSAQIAVLDVYKGAKKPEIVIQDAAGERSEQLAVDNVVAVNPGRYELALGAVSGGNSTEAKKFLVAQAKESYVVLRVGVESTSGDSFPEELLVYPSVDTKDRSAAAGVRPAFAAMVVAIFAGACCVRF